MKHYGDITKLSGYTLPVVDVITGGSPCQDLSVAGKRAGLDGERSGLFMEQIRIVKEMREHDKSTGRTGFLVRPRYCVWENVPGAFSSNGGRDFQAVLTEFARIAEPDAPDVPMPEKGRWLKSGCIYDDLGGWSVAWRVHDAQFWGVPQRRKRIALVADFGGLSAPEILFERKGLSRNIEQSGTERKETAGGAGGGAAAAGFKHKASGTAGSTGYEVERAPSLIAGQEAAVYDARGNGDGKTVCTLTGNHQDRVTDYTALCVGNGQLNNMSMSEQANTLDTMHDQQAVMVSAVDCRNLYEHYEISGTLQSKQTGGFSLNYQNPIRVINETAHTLKAKANCDFRADLETYPMQNNIVRRLTPLECERLQGYPDGWTDIGDWTDSKGKKHKAADSPRYKALGNSIALPFWQYLARRICAQYERDITMGSLFDGIGGFPLVFERCGAKAVWASEIEEFPIAVTKHHFPDKEATNAAQ